MWRDILHWVLSFVKTIGDFGTWLFTPINVNVLANTQKELENTIDKTTTIQLSMVPKAFLNFLEDPSNPFYITPITLISVSTITMLIGIFFLKKLIK